jgi:predicted membrane channel-forming protein YqfA (hemolysin III family)
LGVWALGVSGIFGESALVNAFRVVAGLGFVVLGLVLLGDWQPIRTRLAPRSGPALLKVFGALSLFVGGGAVVTGTVQLFVAA